MTKMYCPENKNQQQNKHMPTGVRTSTCQQATCYEITSKT